LDLRIKKSRRKLELDAKCDKTRGVDHTASLQFRWLARPRLHGLFVGEVLVFLLFKGKLIKHANHRMRQEAVASVKL
jgi:hypothetical protein